MHKHASSYLATGHYPVGDSQEGKPYCYPQHRPALHTDGLLPQAWQVLIPDSQQLLLAVGMSNKLKIEKKKTRNLRQEMRSGHRSKRDTGAAGKMSLTKTFFKVLLIWFCYLYDCVIFILKAAYVVVNDRPF